MVIKCFLLLSFSNFHSQALPLDSRQLPKGEIALHDKQKKLDIES